MTTTRPLVEVFQEFEDQPVTAATPDQPGLIVAPAYHIRDYSVDKTNLSIGDYGSEDAHCDDTTGESLDKPVSNNVEIAVSGVPDSPEGAYQLDNESLRGWMDSALVEVVAEGSPDGNVPNAGENLFKSDGNISNFASEGVRPGDRLVITDTDGPYSIERVIIAVGGITYEDEDEDPGIADDELLVRKDFPDGTAETGLQGGSQTTLSTNLAYRIEKEVSDRTFYENGTPEDVLDIAGPENDEIDVFGGVQLNVTVDNTDPESTVEFDIDGDFDVNASNVYLDYRALRQDLGVMGEVQPDDIESVAGRVDERNPLAIGLKVGFDNTRDAVPLKYYGLPADNLNGQEDLGTAVQDLIDHLSTKQEVYSIAFLRDGRSHLINLKNHAEGMSDPERAEYRAVLGGGFDLPAFRELVGSSLGQSATVTGDDVDIFVDTSSGADFTAGYDDKTVRERDDLVIVQDHDMDSDDPVSNDEINDGEPLTIQELYPGNQTLRTEVPSGSPEGFATEGTTTESFYIARGNEEVIDEFDVDVGPSSGTGAEDVVQVDTGPTTDYEGYLMEVTDASAGGNTGLSTVNSDTYLITEDNTGGADNEYILESGVAFGSDETVRVRIKKPVYSKVNSSVSWRKPFRIVEDGDGTFIASNVTAGDFIEIPLPAQTYTSEPDSEEFEGNTYLGEVEEVLSDNRVRLVDTADVPSDALTTAQSDLGFRVVRGLDKGGQTNFLSTIPGEIGSKRLLLMWPDEVKLSGVQNGRTGVQNWLPGYYIAAAITGMSASLPPHQGLTNIAVNGIDQIRHADDYFTYSQVSDLSNNGWFFLEQENAQSPPTVIHQVTTDTSALQNTEWSLVRTVDYVSTAYKNVLDDFIGEYNVTESTLELLAVSVDAQTEDLTSENLPKIGSPLISGRIDTLRQSPNNDDEVELVIDAEFPAPLNRIKLTVRG